MAQGLLRHPHGRASTPPGRETARSPRRGEPNRAVSICSPDQI